MLAVGENHAVSRWIRAFVLPCEVCGRTIVPGRTVWMGDFAYCSMAHREQDRHRFELVNRARIPY